MAEDFLKNQALKDRWNIAGIAALTIIVLVLSLSYFKFQRTIETQAIDAPPNFVGREKCKDCHRVEYEKWKGSHHDKAMDIASEETVLGDFNDARISHNGITTRFFKKDEGFFVRTQGPDGRMADFEITHTFGFHPLQQYLVPFAGGRLQCLTIAWDDMKKQWYPLPNHTDDPDDWLHWTKAGQNWNGMCAECHSTNLKKGFDMATNTFHTTWSEIDVSCEACHGPGSDHVAWAEQPVMARQEIEKYGLVVDTTKMETAEMVQSCARCHSRRSSIDDFSHFHGNMMDSMIPSLLTPELYYADGQILDEVYVYGSFTQSKMFLRDVKCSDCHDVHSQALKQDGNALCLTCHRKDIYDTQDHHFHKHTHEGKESPGDDCVKCHMPETPYMGIDLRADHSIRIPRPDLSESYATPNACNAAGCHGEKSLQWTSEKMSEWYGKRKRKHYADAIFNGRAGSLSSLDEIISLAKDQLSPAIVRATALDLLVGYPVPQSVETLKLALIDTEPLIRQTAISAINQLGVDKDAKLIFPLLYDPVKAVRIQAALAVAGLQNLDLSSEQQRVLNKGIEEFIEAMAHAGDFPASRFNLGLMYSALGKIQKTIENYQAAIAIDRKFIPAHNNLAMLYNRIGQNQKAEHHLRQILSDYPNHYEIAYSLGLLLAEEKKYQEAAFYLKKAASGLPGRPRIHYNLGILLQLLKQYPEAEKALLRTTQLQPDNFEFMFGLADHYIKSRQFEKALKVAVQIQKLYPDQKIGFEIAQYARRQLKSKE